MRILTVVISAVFGAHITRIVNKVASSSPVNMAQFQFFRVISTDDSDVCGFAVLQDLIKWNKKDHVSALGCVAIRTEALS